MTALCAVLALLFAFVALAPTQPVEARIDYTPAARSSR
jgi:hypothetical protein